MSTYAEYQEKIAELQKMAEEARRTELSAAKSQIAAIMQEHGLSLADLMPTKTAKPPKAHKPVAAKYRDESTGQEWTGRGRAPKWLADLSPLERDKFLINPATAVQA